MFLGILSLRRVPGIGVPRHIVEERMQPFHLRAIERFGGAAVSADDFYAFLGVLNGEGASATTAPKCT